MEKRFKMVLLPTEKATNIIKDRGELEFIKNKQIASTINSIVKGYFLYILDTQATIKIGDWIVLLDDVDLIEVCSHIQYTEGNDGALINGFFTRNLRGDYIFKVIATTDTSLNLPIIPEELIQEYVEEQFEYVPEKWLGFCHIQALPDNQINTNFDGIEEEHSFKSTRELAIEWWGNSNIMDCIRHGLEYYPGRDIKSLTGREIERIWKREVHSKQYPVTDEFFKDDEWCSGPTLKEMKDLEPKPQVDFEMLKRSISELGKHIEDGNVVEEDQPYAENLFLFFNMLKKSSSFAHKAHVLLRD